MISNKDIERSVTLFRKWDLEKKWKVPEEIFIKHIEEKAHDCLDTAQILLALTKNKEIVLKLIHQERFNPSLWVINSSYYHIFFEAQLLLAYDHKKLPENIEDTHKTVFLAILYYFIIKGSGLEGKKNIRWEEIKGSKMSKALVLFAEAQQESEQILQWQRAKSAIENFNAELEKRRTFTYKLGAFATENLAATSYQRAVNFRTIVTEYISIQRRR